MVHLLRRTALAATVLTLLVLAGCSDDAPSIPPSPSDGTAAAAESTTATTKAPVDLSSAPPDETAQQFIRRWFAVSNEMLSTGDDRLYLSLTGPDCTACKSYARRVRAIYRDGGDITGGRERVRRLEAESDTVWRVYVHAGATTFTSSADGEVRHLDGGNVVYRLYLGRHRGDWLVGWSESVPS